LTTVRARSSVGTGCHRNPVRIPGLLHDPCLRRGGMFGCGRWQAPRGSQDLQSRGRSVVQTGLTDTVDTAVCGILGSLHRGDDGSDTVVEELTGLVSTSGEMLILARLLVCPALLAVLLTVDGVALEVAVALADVGEFGNAVGTGGIGGTVGAAVVVGATGLGGTGGTTEFDGMLMPVGNAEFIGIAVVSGITELGLVPELRKTEELFSFCKCSPDP